MCKDNYIRITETVTKLFNYRVEKIFKLNQIFSILKNETFIGVWKKFALGRKKRSGGIMGACANAESPRDLLVYI